MTFEEYINNPMGVKNAVISHREMYRKMYMEKLDRIMTREVGKIDYWLYKSPMKYYCYMKIPSEVVPKFYYDVVIEFSEPKHKTADASLRNYDVRFFSNDPSFVFTFAFAFKKNKIFIDEYKDKMSRRALMQRADEKNPSATVGYVKSLYFAYLLMKKRDLFVKSKYILPYSKNLVLKNIMPADQKIEDRQQEGERLKNKKKREVANINTKRQEAMRKDLTKGIGKVKTIGKISSIGSNNIKQTKISKKR